MNKSEAIRVAGCSSVPDLNFMFISTSRYSNSKSKKGLQTTNTQLK